MKLNIFAFLLAASAASAQYSNGTVTLQPSSASNSDGTATVTGDEISSTTTVTLFTTITRSDGSIATSFVNEAVQEVYAEDITSTLTTTSLATITLVNSASEATATTVSAVEKQIELGALSCVPETVTVTQYETTKYVTVGETSSSIPTSSAPQAFYSNQTSTLV